MNGICILVSNGVAKIELSINTDGFECHPLAIDRPDHSSIGTYRAAGRQKLTGEWVGPQLNGGQLTRVGIEILEIFDGKCTTQPLSLLHVQRLRASEMSDEGQIT